MLNQVVLVGRIAKEVKIKEDNYRKVATLTISCPRSFKNMDGVYENDIINCVLYEHSIAKNVMEYLKKGDVVGIKGRLQSNGKKLELIAERLTFLSNRTKEEE